MPKESLFCPKEEDREIQSDKDPQRKPIEMLFLAIDRQLRGTSARSLVYIKDVLEKMYGLEPDVIRDWIFTHNINPQDGSKVVIENLERLHKLESRRHGIGRMLQSRFNLTAFARYPEELLIDQVDQMDLKDGMPHGIIIAPKGDKDGTFYSYSGIFSKLRKGFRDKIRLRIWETKNADDLTRVLFISSQTYGQSPLGAINGHGDKFSIVLDYSTREEFNTGHIKEELGRAFKKAFSPNGVIILNACSTGAPGGLKDCMEKILGLRVFAPIRDAGIRGVDVESDRNGKLHLMVKYAGEKHKRNRAMIDLS